jgi:hypothetical protein
MSADRISAKLPPQLTREMLGPFDAKTKGARMFECLSTQQLRKLTDVLILTFQSDPCLIMALLGNIRIRGVSQKAQQLGPFSK